MLKRVAGIRYPSKGDGDGDDDGGDGGDGDGVPRRTPRCPGPGPIAPRDGIAPG